MPVPTINNPTKTLPAQIASLLQTLRQLFRAELSAMVALSALAGYLFFGGLWSPHPLLVTAGVGLLAAGCSALNQWQEQDLDMCMERTQNRPLPTGQLAPHIALLLASLAISGGSLLLLALPGSLSLLLGLLAVIWYNAVYTPLKRHTAFAAIPGAICGALPPLIGWTAAGGDLLTHKALILAGTLFVWQIPHTWLLLCRYRDDLQRSGLPNIFKTIPTQRLLRINNCWLAGLFLCYLLFPLFGFIHSPLLMVSFVFGLFIIALSILKQPADVKRADSVSRTFHLTNISMALFLTVLILDRLVN
ncbi:protoheme IX farnesyltransferase [Desulfuromusa kysingii]|uniref:Protoheme IX farnesyltransferase n=1 Tax=Desulfuromusa kysingii TaxID=37625 RepID=A0A1H3W651_9BACT|nr:protoheme IX farnesyltransferase [Desulfuromusa kysingii]SDZ82311.1 protoheme IX farnesyltransferase [Desulfuromusa kysingii]